MDYSNKIKFLINSTKKNIDVVLEKLITSFYEQNSQNFIIKNTDILVVVNDCDEISFKKCDKYCILYVKHNSIDFTALIAVIEHIYSLIDNDFEIPDYWFYMHDTCKLGSNFLNLLETYIEKLYNYNLNTLSLTYVKSMNIGIYKYNYLLNKKNIVLNLRSQDNPPMSQIQELKKVGVALEDILFKNDDYRLHFFDYINSMMYPHLHDRTYVSEPKNIYEKSDIKRIEEYFANIDFYKYKANWELKKEYILDP